MSQHRLSGATPHRSSPETYTHRKKREDIHDDCDATPAKIGDSTLNPPPTGFYINSSFARGLWRDFP